MFTFPCLRIKGCKMNCCCPTQECTKGIQCSVVRYKNKERLVVGASATLAAGDVVFGSAFGLKDLINPTMEVGFCDECGETSWGEEKLSPEDGLEWRLKGEFGRTCDGAWINYFKIYSEVDCVKEFWAGGRVCKFWWQSNEDLCFSFNLKFVKGDKVCA